MGATEEWRRGAGWVAMEAPPWHTRSAVVAVGTLTGICRAAWNDSPTVKCDCGPWAHAGSMHWQIADVRQLADPLPMHGALGVRRLPGELAEQILERAS